MKRIKLLITVTYYFPSIYKRFKGVSKILAPTIFVYNNHSYSQYFLVKEGDHIRVFENFYPACGLDKIKKSRKEKTYKYPIIGGYLELTKPFVELSNKYPKAVIDEYLLGEILLKKAYYYGNINKILEYVGTEDEYRSQSEP